MCVVACYIFLRVHAGPVSRTIQCLSSWASQVVTQPCTTNHGTLTVTQPCTTNHGTLTVTQPCTTNHGTLTLSLSQSVSSNVIQLPGVSFLSTIKDKLGILRDDVNRLYEDIVVGVLKFTPSLVASLLGSNPSGYPQFWTGSMTSIQLLTKIWKDLTTYFMYVDVVATKEQRQVQALSRLQQESLEYSANTLLHDLEAILCYLQSAVNPGVDNHIDINQPMLACNILDMDDSDYSLNTLRVIHDFKTYINEVILFIGSA